MQLALLQLDFMVIKYERGANAQLYKLSILIIAFFYRAPLLFNKYKHLQLCQLQMGSKTSYKTPSILLKISQLCCLTPLSVVHYLVVLYQFTSKPVQE